MSCFNLRLPPAKKAWKSFTSKLQTRLLHKLHKSKAIKKPKNNRLQLQTAAASKTTRPSLLLGQRLQRKSRRRRPLPFGYHRYYFSNDKAAVPIYIDKLFKEAPDVTEVLVGCIHQHPSENSDVKREKNAKLINEVAAAAEAGTSEEAGEKQGDDMWESIGLASPILHGIDAKAEEFIASFRAEMERQEIIARNL
ncbi:hypothetical protein DITRI_Ditri13aG0102600 [Diplodiscus trichospermus]